MTEFTPYLSLFGGVLIGLSAIALMALHGRVAGMTGILSGIVPPVAADWAWRAAFLAGAIMAPIVFIAAGGGVAFSVPVSTLALVVGGFVVGIGVTYGAGCTSGHGVCGMARLSPRSIVATVVFMIAAFATVYVVRHMIGA
ncbi:YeeE/YedE family protein [Nitratireductor sp. CAU 1489]|uniref:YeeE/YedE family protein n=1 Tax=Nitratireductor arenosus TaxID=2682096 RepID=A0A844QNK8_9HYPH|nr:YeeE/YedE family protein [Nitratireductor arenosus]MVA99530.1 YeeE/YedE family protein [Nitratireductor arenosus]